MRLTPICIGETPALLLGPLTVEPPFRERGVGRALIERALERGQGQGPQAGACWSATSRITPSPASSASRKGQVKMPGPVDPARLLVAELVDGAFDGVPG